MQFFFSASLTTVFSSVTCIIQGYLVEESFSTFFEFTLKLID